MIPFEAEQITSRYLSLVDAELPGPVVGFYLTGSTCWATSTPARHPVAARAYVVWLSTGS
jgi:hypothetical protein